MNDMDLLEYFECEKMIIIVQNFTLPHLFLLGSYQVLEKFWALTLHHKWSKELPQILRAFHFPQVFWVSAQSLINPPAINKLIAVFAGPGTIWQVATIITSANRCRLLVVYICEPWNLQQFPSGYFCTFTFSWWRDQDWDQYLYFMYSMKTEPDLTGLVCVGYTASSVT